MNHKQQQSTTPNKLEQAGYALLDELLGATQYERQNLLYGKFCVDAYVADRRLVIQFDGDYWHGNPAKFSELDHRQSKRVRLDKSQDSYLATCGETVLRIWESELRDNPDAVRARLQLLLTPA